MPKEKTVWITDDGEQFDTEREALNHEAGDRSDSVQRYLQTYAGRKLLEEHDLDEHGIWAIRGEDPNCDLGGHHHMPTLGCVEGILEEVINHAVALPNFWTWGGGGEIIKMYVNVLNSTNEKETV